MPDLAHQWSGDLVLAPTGTLALADGPLLGLQRVLRRLMTGPGEYIWNPTYGAGLPAAVGQPANTQRIRAVILAQMQLEARVAASPPPTVTVTVDPAGIVFAAVAYADAVTGAAQTISLPLGAP